MLVLTETAQPGAILQVVRQTIAAPGLAVDVDSPVGQSYRQLLGSAGPLPLNQTTWVAVRLDGRRLAEAGAMGGTEVEAAPLVVAALARRLCKSLRHAGIQCQVLDAQALTGALAGSCDLEPEPGGAPAPSREDWTAWHSRLFAHRSFWVRDWPPVERAAGLFDLFDSAAPMTAVALTLSPDDDLVDLQCLVRVAAPAAMLPQVCARLTRRAPKFAARLHPLDGEQGPATYATAPTGGGSR
jgi:type VII secretion protein EccE